MTKAAVGQLCSRSNIQENLAHCVRLVREASAGGAKVLFLPEASDYIAISSEQSLSLAQPQDTSPFVLGLQAAAKEHAIDVHVGIHVPVPAEEGKGGDGEGEEPATTSTKKLLNRTIWIRADGTIDEKATYDKVHLFDYGALRESATVEAGTRLTPPFDTVLGRVGSLICFDLRFPEPAIALTRSCEEDEKSKPAQILTYPSAFTVRTGRAHWEVLLRARAVETQSWVVAAAQCGFHGGNRISWGESLVVDPWGEVVSRMGNVDDDAHGFEYVKGKGRKRKMVEVNVVNVLDFVDVDLEAWEKVRKEMPLLRRTDVYPAI